MLALATRAFDRARQGAGELPLRLGYVSWLPPEALAIPDPRVRVDEWVLPSHTQTERVAEGSLDLAIAGVEAADGERYKLATHLLQYERLEVVLPRAHPSARLESVPAAEVTVLVDLDEASWRSWNVYAFPFAEASQASVINIDDGGIAGPAFFDHVARLRKACARGRQKRHAAPMPPTMIRRPVPISSTALGMGTDPQSRRNSAKSSRVVQTLIDHASTCGWRTPPSEPHWPDAKEDLAVLGREANASSDGLKL